MGGLGPGIGGFELVVIAIVALVVVGPKDLPLMMRKVGKVVGKARAMANEFRASFDEMARQSELDDLRKEVEALRTGQGVHRLGPDADAAFREIRNDLNRDLNAPASPPAAPALTTPEGDTAADSPASVPEPAPVPAAIAAPPSAKAKPKAAPKAKAVAKPRSAAKPKSAAALETAVAKRKTPAKAASGKTSAARKPKS